MGISTIRSYRGAQIFEALGVSKKVIDKYFCKTTSKMGGVSLDEIAKSDEYYQVNHKNLATSVSADDDQVTLVADGLKLMLTEYGFGAKTSSGFGVAEDDVDDGIDDSTKVL